MLYLIFYGILMVSCILYVEICVKLILMKFNHCYFLLYRFAFICAKNGVYVIHIIIIIIDQIVQEINCYSYYIIQKLTISPITIVRLILISSPPDYSSILSVFEMDNK